MELLQTTLEIKDHIAYVSLNRPQKANALDQKSWDELLWVFEELELRSEARVVVLSGEGKHFSAGIDLSLLMSLNQDAPQHCEGRKREYIRKAIKALQAPVEAIENCSKPVIAMVHGACVGGALDIAAACDMRYSTQDAYFSIKEIDIGMVADLGTLQRLPSLIGEGRTRELAYTGRKVLGIEAQTIGLVNTAYEDQAALRQGVEALAAQIAAKSPLSIRGTKEILRYSRDHTVADGLNYVATWNAAMLLSEDLQRAFQAKMLKQAPVFEE